MRRCDMNITLRLSRIIGNKRPGASKSDFEWSFSQHKDLSLGCG